jgi:hypothetical protein
MPKFGATFDTVGRSKLGFPVPKGKTETVPVGDTYTRVELVAVGVEHGIWQKVVGVAAATSDPHAPENVFPRRSNLMITGNVVSSTLIPPPRLLKVTT